MSLVVLKYLRTNSDKDVRRTPHPVIVTTGDTRNYIRVLLYSYDTTTTGWGVHLIKMYYEPTCRYTSYLMFFRLASAVGSPCGPILLQMVSITVYLKI